MMIKSPVTDNKICFLPLFHKLVLTTEEKWVFEQAQSHQMPSSSAAGAHV